jgi:hypothetical protein
VLCHRFWYDSGGLNPPRLFLFFGFVLDARMGGVSLSVIR